MKKYNLQNEFNKQMIVFKNLNNSIKFDNLVTLWNKNRKILNQLKKSKDIKYKELIKLQQKILNKISDLIIQTPSNIKSGGGKSKILVRTSDNKDFIISGKISTESILIKNILQDVGESDKPIPLPRISEKILNIIDNNIETNDFDTLIQLANAANYLSMDNYLDKITTKISIILKQKLENSDKTTVKKDSIDLEKKQEEMIKDLGELGFTIKGRRKKN